MEPTEPPRPGHKREGMPKRRLSSILKAPRPSMNALGSDQDENQDETRSLDKRRSSRRVSFAAKNNIHVFPKDIKADPVLAHIQNVAVGPNDGQSENMQCFFGASEKPEIMGLDTMQSTSIHTAVNKENFFPEPVLPDSLDRTMFFGESTGCVDITQSHTIAIDFEEAFNPECTLNTFSEPPKLISQNHMPCKTPSTTGKDLMLSEFNDFLASLSKTNAQNVAAAFPQKNSKFTLENTSNAEIDKENVLPIYGQNRTDRFQRTLSLTSDYDDMEITQSQTVLPETKYGGEPFFKSTRVSSLASSITGSADRITMNTTQTGNITPGASKTEGCKRKVTLLTHNQSDFLELSHQALTGNLPPNVDASLIKGCSNVARDSKHVPMTSVMMSKPQASFMPLQSVTPEVKRPDQLSVSHVDADMEMTECHTVGFNLEKTYRTVGDMELTECHSLGYDLEKTRHAVGDMEMTECHIVDYGLEKTRHTEGDMEMTECHTVGYDLEKTRHTVSNMEMTECHTVGYDMEKTRHTDGDMEMTECHTVGYDMEKTRHTVGAMEVIQCQSVGDDMEMTECQTIVLEPKVCHDYKPADKSSKRLSLMSTPFGTNGITHEHTGHTELNRYSSSKRTKTESCVVPTAQRLLLQDLPDYMHEGSASDMPGIHDDLEMTECKTIAIETNTSWVKSNENHEEKQKEVVSAVTGVDLPEHQRVDNKNYNNVNVNVSLHSLTKNVESSEDCDMEMTRAFTVPLEEQVCAAFNQGEMAKEVVKTAAVTTDQRLLKENDQPLATTSKTAKKGYVLESDNGTLVKEHSSSGKPRRMSLADLQVKLQNISQYINEPDRQLAGSVTEPLVSFTVVSPVKKHPERQSSLQPSKEMQLLEKINLPHKEGTTPFSLKNSLLARLSVGGGVMPKFPPRGRSVSPTQTEPQSPTGVQGLLQTCLSTDVLNDGYETDLVNEVLPEEDFSGTLVSYQSENKEQVTTVDSLNEDATQFHHTESVTNQNLSEKMPPEVKDTAMKETSSTLWESSCAPQNAPGHVVKVMDDTSSSSSYTTMKCEGISELKDPKDSQLDSLIEGPVNHEFDFHKKLEDGSVTVNQFLTHFGAKFVIHRSRPSARPDNFRDAETCTTENLLRDKYIHHPKQKVYETDCQNLSDMVEELRTQIEDQDKPLRAINDALLQDVCAFSHKQLQRFGAKLKERKVYFSKTSKARSHRMKECLYSELLQTTREAKESLSSKIKETHEMLEELDGCINDLESELMKMNNMDMGDQHSLKVLEPDLKAKQEQIDALNSDIAEKERQICKFELQAQSLDGACDKLQCETRELECRTSHLNRLNEWRLKLEDKNRLVFTFLHETLQLDVKHKHASGKECVDVDAEQDVDISFKFLLNAECSQPSAVMVHKLLEGNINSQLSTWMQKYSTTQSIPMLLHDVSVVVSRLRLLGEEIHRLKKWGGLKFEILDLSCVDTEVEVTFSSLRAFVKFELSLAISPDYPFKPLQLQKFRNHIGNTRVEQIKDIMSSIRPTKSQLTAVIKRLHSHLIG